MVLDRSTLRSTTGATMLLLLACGPTPEPGEPGAQPAPPPPEAERVVGYTFTPHRREFDMTMLGRLQTPAGFRVDVFATGMGNPRMMAVAPDGGVYITRPRTGDVVLLRDRDGDGRADEQSVVVSGIEGVHGIALHQGRAYLAAPTAVYVADVRGDGRLGTPRTLIADLPDGGQHPNRTLAIGPDGMLYISIGSTCNACVETNPEHAALIRTRLDGTARTLYARGLRNTIGFAFHPQTRELWGMDHGTDWRGNDTPPEELNRIVAGGDYGWPFCYGRQQVDELFAIMPEGMTREAYCARTQPAVLTYTAHSAPIGLAFYDGAMFPAEYRGDAFVAMRGSWNRVPASGYKVVRIRFRDGSPVAIEDFVSGFLLGDGRSYFARPAGIAVARDGALLVSDDTNGVIYRIAYAG
ncbi:MAG: sorbosone dehydrogenase family protein [bacterium]|jgi:glucose/arabinose dehydrogenase|nr:MAG: oxidoreductase [bacterium]